MKRFYTLGCLLFFISFSVTAFAQYKPGMIIREAGNTTGKDILNPSNATRTASINTVGDAPAFAPTTTTVRFSSATTSGWTSGGDDTSAAANEIPYKPLKNYGGEPCCDLRRGPDHKFSDFVPDKQNNGVYWYYSTAKSAYLFRMRMGAMIPGSKGFSLLVDTDGKYGNTGDNKDPNYVAKTTGINGNPGFEIEIVMETNFRLAIYNIDGKGNPSDGIENQVGPANIVTYTPWTNYSQWVLAATTDSDDPDYFLDFYVPLDGLQSLKISDSKTGTIGTSFITDATTPLRIIPTTVMAPKPSTAGPISDIYGSDMDHIKWTTPICSTCTPNQICTPAPTITATSFNSVTGEGTVSGNWSKETTGYTGSGSATITLYKKVNGVLTPLTTSLPITCNSGGNWSATIPNTNGLVATDVIYAKAKGTSGFESNGRKDDNSALASDYCFTSAGAKIAECTTRPAALTITALGVKGIEGAGYAGSTTTDYITVYKISNLSSPTASFLRIGPVSLPITSGNTSDKYRVSTAPAWDFNGGATNGQTNQNLKAGAYVVYDSLGTTGCTSRAGFSTCLLSSATTPATTASLANAPTLTSAASITTSTQTISGKIGTGNTRIRVFMDGIYDGEATIDGTDWTYSFSKTPVLGTEIRISGQATETSTVFSCPAPITFTVVSPGAGSCSTPNSTPFIDVDATSEKITPGFKLTGIGTPGASVAIYRSPANTVRETVVVGTDGTWTSTFNTSYNAATETGYYVQLTTTGCSTPAVSSTALMTTLNSDSKYCGGIIMAGVNGANGQVYGTGATATLYADETVLSGTLAGTTDMLSGATVKMYLDGNLIGTSSVNTANNTWGPITVTDLLYQGAVLTIGVVQGTGYGEYTCASVQVVCDCKKVNIPAKPDLTGSTTQVTSPNKATIIINNPTNYSKYYFRNKYTKKALKPFLDYTSGNQSARLVGTGDMITVQNVPVDSTQTAEVQAIKIGSETCTSTEEVPLVLNQVMPVTLIEFKGVRASKMNVISWKTASEIDFSHFELEKSTDGLTFVKIKSVTATGVASDYGFNDENVLQSMNYYRLKMVDLDGRFKYSNTIVISGNNSVTLNTIRPNPFVNDLRISINLQKDQQINMVLVDAYGHQIKIKTIAGVKGYNEIILSQLNGLTAGMYTLKIYADGNVYQEKLVKVNY
jgi:hypothetical protein